MPTKGKSAPKKDSTKSSQPQGLLKKTEKKVLETLSSMKSTFLGNSSGAKNKSAQKGNSNGVYVKGITHKQSLDDLKSIFSAAGEIKDSRRRSNKFALIWFKDNSSVKKAIDLFHHKKVDSFTSSAAPQEGEKVSMNEQYRKHYPGLYASGKSSSSGLGKFIVQQARVHPTPDRETYCTSIFVSGIPSTNIVPRAELLSAFGQYGKVIKMVIHNKTNFVFVYYSDVASAVKAQKEVDGKKLSILFKDVVNSLKQQPKSSEKKQKKPFVLPSHNPTLAAKLSIRTKDKDDVKEAASRKYTKHKEDYRKWVRGIGF